jgi:hypothetical protein
VRETSGPSGLRSTPIRVKSPRESDFRERAPSRRRSGAGRPSWMQRGYPERDRNRQLLRSRPDFPGQRSDLIPLASSVFRVGRVRGGWRSG